MGVEVMTFEEDYDGHTGERIYIPEYDEALHIRQFPIWREMRRRIGKVDFNRCWRSISLLRPAAKLTVKTRLPGGRKSTWQAMYRDRLDDLEAILRG